MRPLSLSFPHSIKKKIVQGPKYEKSAKKELYNPLKNVSTNKSLHVFIAKMTKMGLPIYSTIGPFNIEGFIWPIFVKERVFPLLQF